MCDCQLGSRAVWQRGGAQQTARERRHLPWASVSDCCESIQWRVQQSGVVFAVIVLPLQASEQARFKPATDNSLSELCAAW
eukprot:4814337-Pleurochrysis_carterae.AAC.2